MVVAPYIPTPMGAIGAVGDSLLDLPEEPIVWPVIGTRGTETSPLLTLVMSCILVRLLSLFIEFKRMKYFWA